MSKFSAILGTHLLLYIIGFAITLDFNPLHWYLFTTWFGRFVLVIAEIGMIEELMDTD